MRCLPVLSSIESEYLHIGVVAGQGDGPHLMKGGHAGAGVGIFDFVFETVQLRQLSTQQCSERSELMLMRR